MASNSFATTYYVNSGGSIQAAIDGATNGDVIIVRAGTYTGAGNIDDDPLFVSGPLHDYYLSQIAAGQAATSPCFDAGFSTAAYWDMDGLTTRTDSVPDTGTVDMGYHAPLYALRIDWITRSGDTVTIHWSAQPGVSYIVQWSDDLITWTDVPVGETDTWIDTDLTAYTKKFYRVRRE